MQRFDSRQIGFTEQQMEIVYGFLSALARRGPGMWEEAAPAQAPGKAA